ncbi:MAG: 3-hydroxyisobutyrate dehydrogenase [Betaproteobacteria bacterium]|jgi:3-hydroxyisobutyrate dehydrogenase|nr:3-hydroxyisobutyrate dehydrogenase [Betaproteobacteria bacterium]
MKIGIAGTGRMGTAIALRLLEKGHEVTVWNRTREKTETAAGAGAKVAPTPAALASACDQIISMLTNAAAMQAVYTGKDGLLSGDAAGKLFIEMSTVRGDDHRALMPRVAAKDAVLIECPVSGTVKPAREGTLFGFAGGTPDAFTDALPLLEHLCRRVELVGAMGAGASMKLAVNLLLTVFWQALAEACSLTQEVPIERERLIDLFADSNIGAGILKARGGLIAAALAGEDTGAASFDVDFMRKDLRDMLQDAKALGVSLPAAARTLECFDEASRGGFGKIDATQYPAWWVSHAEETERA